MGASLSSRMVLCTALACLVMLASLPSAGQAPEVAPPKLLEDPGSSYPRRALEERFYEETEVVLILELDASGKVVRVEVETPRGHGFDEAALAGAEALRFEPALRAGTPVPARIKYRYRFEPPAPELKGTVFDWASLQPVRGARITIVAADGVERSVVSGPDGSWLAPEVARGAARLSVESPDHTAQAIDVELRPGEVTQVSVHLQPKQDVITGKQSPAVEVIVRGERLAPAVSSYSRAEVRQIPGAFGDPFRAVETLPGVTPLASGLPFFYVRGAPPGNVGYFFDGIRVPYLYHVGFGPSVMQPALIERVDLHPGGYPARFGRFAGGIVAAEATEPSTELHAEGNLRLFDVGGMVETGFDQGRGSVLLGGRYSYTGALLSLVAPEVKLDYRDYQARVSYDFTADDRVSVLSFGSYDLLGEYKNDILDILFGTEFYRAELRYDRRLPAGNLRTAVTLGYERTSAGFIAGERRNVIDRSLGVRSELRHELGEHAVARAGADFAIDAYSVQKPEYADPDSPETQDFNRQFPSRTDRVAGAWLDFVLRMTPRIEVIPGLRADLYNSGSTTVLGLDPRIAARFEINDDLRILHAYGLAHQAPSFALPLPGLTPGELSQGLQRSLQTSAGMELDLDSVTMLTTTVFYNAFFNMSDAIGVASGEGPPDFRARGKGSAMGAELFLKRRLTGRLGGFFTYTLSRSLRSNSRETFFSAADRTHVVNAAVAYDLGRGFRSGARAVFYTGAPVATSSGAAVTRTTRTEREPAFFRLDLRFEKRWNVGRTGFLSLVTEVMNATLNKETFGDEEIGPVVIPSLGLEAGF
jgi:TonB family protein